MASEPQGLDWQDLCRGHCYILNILSCGPHGFREEKSMGANDPWGVASLDPRGLVGRIYVGDHLTLLHS